MNLQQLRDLVAQGESERCEFKRTTGELAAAGRTVCAMLNGLGGFVFFGVRDGGRIVGQSLGTSTLEDIAQTLRRIEPPAFPEIETITLDDGNAVIVLRISGGGGPYTYDGRPYLRFGSTTQIMPRDQYERVLLDRMHTTRRWKNQPAEGIGLDQLDRTEVVRTVEEAIRRGRLDDPATRDLETLLLGLGLIHNGNLLNAAVVLFGSERYLRPSYPQCRLRMARFRGRDKTDFIDNRQEVGHAFDLLVHAQRFLRDHLPVAGRIVPNLFERVDDPLYPPVALREALANALCHRDYSIGGGAVSVGLFDDRLEIASTGDLHFGLTPDDLLRPHPSRPWNPLIAEAFYRRGIIESWGRGTLKIVELTAQAGLALPEFESTAGEVIVRFRPTRYVPPTRVGLDLSPLQRDLLDHLAHLGAASLNELKGALATETPRRTVQDNLQMLRRLDLVDVSGTGRSARWRLKQVQS